MLHTSTGAFLRRLANVTIYHIYNQQRTYCRRHAVTKHDHACVMYTKLHRCLRPREIYHATGMYLKKDHVNRKKRKSM